MKIKMLTILVVIIGAAAWGFSNTQPADASPDNTCTPFSLNTLEYFDALDSYLDSTPIIAVGRVIDHSRDFNANGAITIGGAVYYKGTGPSVVEITGYLGGVCGPIVSEGQLYVFFLRGGNNVYTANYFRDMVPVAPISRDLLTLITPEDGELFYPAEACVAPTVNTSTLDLYAMRTKTIVIGTVEYAGLDDAGDGFVDVVAERYLQGRGPNRLDIAPYYYDLCQPDFAEGQQYIFFIEENRFGGYDPVYLPSVDPVVAATVDNIAAVVAITGEPTSVEPTDTADVGGDVFADILPIALLCLASLLPMTGIVVARRR